MLSMRRPSNASFRNAVRACTIATTAALAFSTAATFSTGAVADEDAIKVSPACTTFAETIDQPDGLKKFMECEFRESDKRRDQKIAAANARSVEAKRISALAQIQLQRLVQVKAQLNDAIACGTFLQRGVDNGSFKLDDLLKAGGGDVNEKNGCDVARQFGYGKRASAASTPAPKGMN